jgi:hypothetical protein
MNTNGQIVSISVNFELDTPDGLKKIDFGLEKDTDDQQNSTWTIHFQLMERTDTTKDFAQVVLLDVKVKTANYGAAENISKNGMTPNQAAYAMGPAATAAAAAKAGTLPQSVAESTVQKVVTK